MFVKCYKMLDMLAVAEFSDWHGDGWSPMVQKGSAYWYVFNSDR
jgi:hypothetical protein